MAQTDGSDCPDTTLLGEPTDHADHLHLSTENRHTAIADDIPIFADGFHWSAKTDRRRVRRFDEADARATADGRTLARGVVRDVAYVDGNYVLHVAPIHSAIGGFDPRDSY